MRILVTNDDGIFAPGIAALVAGLAKLGTVYVSAPDHNCSANSHHLTMHDDVTAVQTAFPGAAAAWAVGGTPADCVHLALSTLLDAPVDIVVSGINAGSNLSTDCLYSGTVAAALEARIMGLPGIAVSLDTFDKEADFSAAAETAARYVPYCLRQPQPVTLNINVPNRPKAQINGVRLAAIDRIQRYPQDNYACRFDAATGKHVYRFVPAACDATDLSADARAVADGYISITPLTCFWSDARQLQAMEDILL